MAANSALDYLLEVEARAGEMLKEAQEDADRRVRANEEANRAAFEQKCNAHMQKRKAEEKAAIEEIKKNYHDSLAGYKREISCVKADVNRFKALLNEYLELG